ncbi:hypothetical protein BAMY_03330 [Bacillus amyloliquefaciens]|uniref:Uncharacterized protein n=1 Tax=Bacillus velezensis TaxID=492670 RepID=A0A6A8LJC6_BACVE|nr:hypothetical protein MA22_06505 [Bacillus subtilis]AJH23039.1 hypothetical protein SB45_03240 [Bacillus velezensis]ALV03965.1 hypothetical protein AVM03_17095 [Bacillus amyloliquefaciens]AVX18298.1 hypothetical protein C5I45_16130 [Bacillus sp. ZY-1-1]ERK81545.1 hypothetical protein N786_19010 [Bacillus amyloliquefaciens UASWS BA1]KMN52334.1 hypothetical protein VK94_19705 [Bacillus sp. LK7]TRW31127.1 hypothetical protein FND48_17510 [Bacillus sp. PW192]
MRFRSSIRFLPFKHYNKFVWPGKTEKDVIHLIHKKRLRSAGRETAMFENRQNVECQREKRQGV